LAGGVEEWLGEAVRVLAQPRSRRDAVYLLLSMLPPGYAVTYSTLARLVGTSPRAVGAWMRANKWLIVVPCHRVVASRGLGGFSRGVEFKKRLLELEAGKRGLRVIRSVEEFWKVLELEGRAVEG